MYKYHKRAVSSGDNTKQKSKHRIRKAVEIGMVAVGMTLLLSPNFDTAKYLRTGVKVQNTSVLMNTAEHIAAGSAISIGGILLLLRECEEDKRHMRQ